MECSGCGRDVPTKVTGTMLLRCPVCRALFRDPAGSHITILPREGSPVPASSIALPAALLERFEIGRVLGQGGMGIVYHARDRKSGTRYAIKLLSRQEPQVVARFIQEGNLQLGLRHTNLVRVHEMAAIDDHPYLLCEFLEGGTLRMRLDLSSRLVPAEAMGIQMQLLHALEALHSTGVVHRDVKPENVLFDARGTAKLGDLGIAKDHRRQLELTDVGMVIGTPTYMSAEQLLGEPASAASDVFAAGVVLYEMLVGGLPWDGSNKEKVRRFQECDAQLAFPAGREPSSGLAKLISHMLAPLPGQRPGSAAECVAALERITTGSGVRKRSVRSADPTTPRGTGWRRVLATATSAALLAALAVAGRSRAPSPVPHPAVTVFAERVALFGDHRPERDLAERAGRLDVPALIARLVRSPHYDRDVSFPGLAAISPLPVSKSTLRARYEPRNPPGFWRGRILAELERAGIWRLVLDFRARAARYWVAEDVPLEEKWRLYHALLHLELLDGLIIAQHDTEQLGLCELRKGFVESSWAAIDRPAPAGPGSRELFSHVTCWVSEDFIGWDTLALWRFQSTSWLAAQGRPPPGGYDDRMVYRTTRAFSAIVLPAPGTRGRVGLRALGMPGPGVDFGVTVRSRGSREAITLHLRNSGGAEWLLAATNTVQGYDNIPVDRRPPLRWGEMKVTIPAEALPPGPLDMEVRLTHLPGVKIEELATLQRGAILAGLALIGE